MHQLNKMKATTGRRKQLDTSETIVSGLSHYLQTDKSKPQSTTKIADDDEEEEISVTSNADPFVEIKATEINNRGRKILDYASDDDEGDSESDTPPTLASTFPHDNDFSDDESIDSEDEDVLKHAGIYQVEEVVKMSKEKMQKLQSLYVDQFQKLQKVLKDKRRAYLQGIKREKEIYSNIYDQYKDSPKVKIKRNLFKLY
jgi:KAT8 regulatory NSL complex subunit 2